MSNIKKKVDPNGTYTPEEAKELGIKIDLFGTPVLDAARNMKDFFIIPPFSIIDTMAGDWQQRKKRWDVLIGNNRESREGTLFGTGETEVTKKVGEFNEGVSVFDACLAEIICKWFACAGFHILDPFAGGNFGYVSSYLDMIFTGFEVRKEQCQINNHRLQRDDFHKSKYIHSSSIHLEKFIADNSQDMLFTCPPYLDLEVYSNDPEDLSTMKPKDFFKVYRQILTNASKKVKDNRFAVIVVSEVRCKKTGRYLHLVKNTIDIMEDAGWMYYNDIILVNSVGTLPLRVNAQMNTGRKVGRRHQNVLVFYKGDAKEIKNNFHELVPPNDFYNNK